MASTAFANKAALKAALDKKARRRMQGGEYAAKGGLYLITKTFDIAADDVNAINDELELLIFPDGAYLVAAGFKFTSLDSNASKTLVLDVNINSNGSVEKTIVNDTQVARAGGYVEADSTAEVIGYDVGGKSLCTKVVTAAATAQAGTVTVNVLISLDAITVW